MRVDAAAAYDALAPRYDAIYQDAVADAENRIVQANLEPIVRRAKSVLDLGCGTGLFLDLFPEMAPRYSGIDISEGMLALAREKHPGATFRQGDMLELTVKQYELVVCLYAGNYVSQVDLAESVYCALIPGGHFFGVFLTHKRAEALAETGGQPQCEGVTSDWLARRYSEYLDDVRVWPMNAHGRALSRLPGARHWLAGYLAVESIVIPSKAANYLLVGGTRA